jgi:type IV pilus assembly protein PilB
MAESITGKTRRLGDLLLDAGIVTDDQLKIALAEQKRTGIKLGDILVDLGIASDESISRALASQSGVEHYDLEKVEIDKMAIRCVPEELARRHAVVPISFEKGTLVLAMANPADIMAIDEIERAGDIYVEPATSSRRQVMRTIDRIYSTGTKDEGALESAVRRAISDLGNEASSNPEGGIIALVEEIFSFGFRCDATDIHFEPDKKVIRVRLRVDGALVQGPTLAASLLAPIVARIKILAQLDISETRIPQDGKIRFPYQDRVIDLRVSTFPCVSGESIVIRVLDRGRATLSLHELGLSPDQIATLDQISRRPNGLILTAGPTGSGKTTTLYALLRSMDTSTSKVITIEDPVEYDLPLASQCQTNEKAGLSFAAGLRAILRHDPDVILVGEMRDQETCQMAFRAALTGHLVLSTIHTNDSVRTMSRLRDMGIEPYMIGSCLTGVCAQRLVRLACEHCREEFAPRPDELAAAGLTEHEGDHYVRAAGCDRCHDTGTKGRAALFEILEITAQLSEVIGRGAESDEIERVARDHGFRSFREQAWANARAGRMTLDEVARVTAEA